MISCDQCQKKIVAVFDNEASEADERLTSAHLKDCPKCRTFQEDMVKIRQQFVSVTMPTLPAALGQELMRQVKADCLSSGASRSKKRLILEPLWARFPRLAWASSVAALFLIVISWLACFALARETASLRQELQVARREVAVAQAEKQLKEAQERQQKAISALYFRMQELEERVDRFSSPRTAFFPTELNGLFDRRSDL